ncbi:unnamed protein product [Urochloa humidicola]
MPAATAMSSSWDAYGGGQIFPADMMLHHQDTLEAVLQQPTAAAAAPMLAAPDQAAAAVDGAGIHGAAAQRRRPFRTDRHSKIRTAQGVRDRRMRLSVGVAREFFALQDRLGFDKASKTVNWLLTQSKPAIDRLHRGADEQPLPPPVVVKGRGEGSSSTTSSCCFKDPRGEKGRSRGGGDGPPAAAPMEEHAGGEIGWIMPDAAAEAVPPQQQMSELEYCYQYYLQLEEMMRCNNGGVPR